MTKAQLQKIFEKANTKHIEFEGHCKTCHCPVNVVVDVADDGEFIVQGGALYQADGPEVWAKCEECFKKEPVLSKFHPVTQYSRIVGYMRPVSDWNPGKRAEFYKRKVFTPFKEKAA